MVCLFKKILYPKYCNQDFLFSVGYLFSHLLTWVFLLCVLNLNYPLTCPVFKALAASREVQDSSLSSVLGVRSDPKFTLNFRFQSVSWKTVAPPYHTLHLNCHYWNVGHLGRKHPNEHCGDYMSVNESQYFLTFECFYVHMLTLLYGGSSSKSAGHLAGFCNSDLKILRRKSFIYLTV